MTKKAGTIKVVSNGLVNSWAVVRALPDGSWAEILMTGLTKEASEAFAAKARRA